MDAERLEDMLEALDTEASGGEKRAYIDDAGRLIATPPALYAAAADMMRVANNRPIKYVSGEEKFWAGGAVGIGKVEAVEKAVEVEKEAFRRERWGRTLYAFGVAGMVVFGLLFLYFFFTWWFMVRP